MLAHLNLHNTIVKKHLVGGNGLDDKIARWFDSPFVLNFQAHFQTSKFIFLGKVCAYRLKVEIFLHVLFV
jgi:hypothetical protein